MELIPTPQNLSLIVTLQLRYRDEVAVPMIVLVLFVPCVYHSHHHSSDYIDSVVYASNLTVL